MPEGATLAQLVAAAIPDAFLRRFVVVRIDGVEIPAEAWDTLTPAGGDLITICVRPGDGDSGVGKFLRTILQIAVIAAAAWVGSAVFVSFLGIPILPAVAAAFTAMLGNLAINALIPIKPPATRGVASETQYTVTGARNAARLYAPVPLVLGKHRFFPPLYGNYVQETVGNDIYLRVPFCLGPAPLQISDIKIGETPISSYEGVEIETRLTADAPPHTLYTGDPDQDAVGVQLTTSYTTRNTVANVDEIEVVLGWRGGLGGYDSKQRKTSMSVSLLVEYRPAGSSESWVSRRGNVVEANTASADAGAPYRPDYFEVEDDLVVFNTRLGVNGVSGDPVVVSRSDPGRGFQYPVRFAVPRHPSGYEVRVRRATTEYAGTDGVDAVWWELLGSTKSYVNPFPEAGLASLVLRIKASKQLNNVIDTLNLVAEPMIPRFSTAAKATPSGATAASLDTVGVSRSPAEIVLNLYRGAQTSRPRPDTHIDWPAWAAFAKFCEDNDLHYDEVVDNAIGRGELARRVCSGAFARPVKWGGKLSVVIDRDRAAEAPAQVFTPRNVSNLRWTKTFPLDTHAVRIAFNNAANGWQADEVTLYLDGYDATNATLYEQLPVPGKTDPDEVRIVGRQYINNSLSQTESFVFDMDAEALTCRLGAYAVLLHDAIDVGLGSARVKSLETSGGNVTAFVLDVAIATDVADTLAARWRKEDGSGSFVVSTEASITRDAANAARFVFASPQAIAVAPAVEEMVLVGRATEVSLPVLVRDIAPDFGNRAQVTVIPYAGERFTPDGTPLPPHEPMVTLPVAARPAAPELLTTAANAREITLAFTQPLSPRGIVVTGYETAVREHGTASDSWQDRGPLPADARVFVAPPGNPGYSYDLRVVAVGRDVDGYAVTSDPLIASNVAAATTPAAPTGCNASITAETSAAGAVQLILTCNWDDVDDPDVLDTSVEVRISTGPDVWAEMGRGRAILGTLELHSVQVGRDYDLRFIHLSRRGIASTPTTVATITAADVLSAASSATIATGIVGQGDLATTNKAALPFGVNALTNTEFSLGTSYPPHGYYSGGAGNLAGVTASPSIVTAGPRRAIKSVMTGTVSSGTFFDLFYGPYADAAAARRFSLPVVAGDVVGASALVAKNAAASHVYVTIQWLNDTGIYISEDAATAITANANGDTGNPADYTLSSVVATAPTNARFANIFVRCLTSAGAVNATGWAMSPMLCRLPAGQTVVPAYTPGPVDRSADRTNDNTAAAILSQGAFATLNSAAYGSGLLTGFGVLASLGQVYFGDGYLKETSGGSTASLSNFKTILGVAASITSQGAFATLNTVNSSGLIDAGVVTYTALASTAVRLGTNITRADGSTSLTDALAVTSLGTAAAIASQGALATLGQVNLGASGRVYRDDGSTRLTDALAVTSLGTAAAFTGQGALATLSLVTGGKLDIADPTNLCLDVNFDDTSLWVFTGGWATDTSADITATLMAKRGITITASGANPQAQANAIYRNAPTYAVEPGVNYRLKVSTLAKAGFKGRLRLIHNWYTQAGVFINGGAVEGADYRTVAAASDTAQVIDGLLVAPANAAFGTFYIACAWPAAAASAGTAFAAIPRVSRAVSYELLTSTAVRLGTNITRADGATSLTDALAVTSLGTAAAITSQGGLATLSFVTIGTNLRLAGGSTVATTADVVTASGTAAAISGQGDLATTNKASLPFGANALTNTEFALSTSYPPLGYTSGGAGNMVGVTQTASIVTAGPRRAIKSVMTGTASSGTYFDLFYMAYADPTNSRRFSLPVVAGDVVGASALIAKNNQVSVAYVNIQWLNDSGIYVSEDAGNHVTANANGDTGNPADYSLSSVVATAPTGARFANIFVRCLPISSAVNATGWAMSPMLCRLPAGQTVVPPYTPGSVDRTADVTSANTAAAIASQGGLATLSFVTISTNLRLADGTTVATTAMVVTASGTAAAIASQGSQATANAQRGSSYSGTPVEGSWWADTSATPNQLKFYTGGSWNVVATIASDNITATASPSSSTVSHGAGGFSTGSITITAAGGSGYTYAWEVVKTSGAGPAPTMSSYTAASSTGSCTLTAGQDVQGFIKCTVSATGGKSVVVVIPFSFNETS